jgi:phage/plasmid primase-like uncharacterized protein
MMVLDDFRQAIAQAGLTAPQTIIPDGKLHRFASNGDRDDDAGWYTLYADGVPAGAFGCWRSGLKQTWCGKASQQMTESERVEQRRRLEVARRLREAEEQRRHTEAADRAKQLWNHAAPAPVDHPYLKNKQVQPHGLRVDGNNQLIVPVLIENTFRSLQFIDADGSKKFLPGGEVKGGAYLLGDVMKGDTFLVCEGFATAASLHEATALPTFMAFSANNLHPVAEQLRRQYPMATILVCGDNDLRSDGTPNTGLKAARAAANAIGGALVMPNLEGQKCDFNDVARANGRSAVRALIEAALSPQPHILDDIYTFLGRFVAYPSEHARVAHTLWIAHTHLMDKWESTPRIAFLSPEPGSGKTRALELTETLVPRPVEAVNVSAAYLFRKVSDEAGLPTILYDEIDCVFGPKAKENEDLRGLLNAGHRRGAVAGRCVVRGKTVETEELPAFCAVALAGLGNLPDTILTRSVVIKMRRRMPSEQVEAYRRRIHASEGNALRDRLAAWGVQIRPTMDLYPDMPPGVADRPADVWEALLAVADAAGGDWPTRARVAAVTLVTDAMGGQGSLGVRLLADLQTVFGDKTAMSTVDILAALIALEEAPWGDLRGKPLDSRRLATFLRPYGVSSKTVRIDGDIIKGYIAEDLFDPWQRYLSSEKDGLPLSPKGAVTSVTNATPDPVDTIPLFEEER